MPWRAGDSNCDGAITAADVVYLINYLFEKDHHHYAVNPTKIYQVVKDQLNLCFRGSAFCFSFLQLVFVYFLLAVPVSALAFR